VRCHAHDLCVFFAVVAKDPTEVTPKDVMAFVTAQRRPRPGAENVVRIDGGSGLSAATIKRRLAAVSSLYGYLITRDDVGVTVNPVPRGIATRPLYDESAARTGTISTFPSVADGFVPNNNARQVRTPPCVVVGSNRRE